MSIIGYMKETAENGTSIWNSGQNVQSLLKYVPVDDMPKLWACYMVAQEHLGVICGEASTAVNEEAEAAKNQMEQFVEF